MAITDELLRAAVGLLLAGSANLVYGLVLYRLPTADEVTSLGPPSHS